MKNSAPRIILYFLIAGFLLPCLLFTLISVRHIAIQGVWAWIIMIPWPTSPLLMSADGSSGVSAPLVAFIISAAANVLLYGLVGSAISFCYRRFFQRMCA